jgi:hypothetical protein
MRSGTVSAGRKLGRLIKAFAALLGLGGAVVIGYQCVWWYQDGFWTPKSPLDLWLWFGFSYSPLPPGGFDQLLLLLLDLPLGAVLLAIGLGGYWLGERLDS